MIEVDVVTDDPATYLPPDDLADLRRAKTFLRNPGVAVRFANLIGTPIELGLQHLPATANRIVRYATRTALRQALRVALVSLGSSQTAPRPRNRFHKILAGASGAVGGAFGLAALPVELPISTTLILRSIAQIAAGEGHDLDSVETRLSCLEVFAFGGDSPRDDAGETSYWMTRAALSKVVADAVGILAGRAAAMESSPAALRFVTAVAARFGVVVSQQVAAKAVPILGAAAGAAINVVFMDHFQKMAQGHFIVRRLEKRHGTETIQRAYESLATPTSPSP
ncbi:MAG: EcsC family protein [Verrucomicrobiales bacterium]|nr:EcsC family protein [Verrucomicrobiales bacterium]